MPKNSNFSQHLKSVIANAVNSRFDNLNFDSEAISLEHPTAEEHGDYSTNVALQLSKLVKRPAREIAEEIVQKISSTGSNDIKIWEKIEVAGPGFINFWLKKEALVSYLKVILKKQQDFGKNRGNRLLGDFETVIVEYSSPNIAKPFGIGHLRSTIIGDAVQKLIKSQGYKVETDNHLGDWGTQFGKLCYAIKTWGDEEAILKSNQPIKELVKLYVRFHKEAEAEKETAGTENILNAGREWFAKLEKGDREARRLWKLCVDISMKEFREIYRLLRVSFDHYNGEAFFEDKLSEIITLVKKSPHVKESEGALLLFYPNEKFPPLMLLKSDGSTLYSTRDLATDKYRVDTYGKSVLIVNETGLEQGLYWNQIHLAEELLGICSRSQRKAVLHGLVLSPEGKKFSTRKGDELWLIDVLNEAIFKTLDLMAKRNIAKDLSEEEKTRIAQAVGIGAVKYNDLKQQHNKDILFDWDKMINLDGDSGPYLQYTYARARSVLQKARHYRDSYSSKPANQSTGLPDYQFTIEELALLHFLYRFPEVVEQAARSYSPNLVCTYLFELAKRFNNFYNNVPILQPVASSKEQASGDRLLATDFLLLTTAFRLSLTEATSIVLKNGLMLLGIEALERM